MKMQIFHQFIEINWLFYCYSNESSSSVEVNLLTNFAVLCFCIYIHQGICTKYFFFVSFHLQYSDRIETFWIRLWLAICYWNCTFPLFSHLINAQTTTQRVYLFTLFCNKFSVCCSFVSQPPQLNFILI